LSTSALSALRLRGFDAIARAARPSWTSPAERIRHRCRTRTFPDGPDSWLICASKSGAATHPAWFINLAKNPDKVWLEVGNRKLKAAAELLKGKEREDALARIAVTAPRYGQYQKKTDREIPVIRLTPAS